MFCMQKSYDESEHVISELREHLKKSLGNLKSFCCFVATNSLRERKITSKSNVCLYGILHPALLVSDKIYIRKKLADLNYRRKFELYPIVSLEDWKCLAKNSALYASALFHSVPIFGETKYHDELVRWMAEHCCPK